MGGAITKECGGGRTKLKLMFVAGTCMGIAKATEHSEEMIIRLGTEEIFEGRDEL